MDVEEMAPLEMSENIQLIADWMRNEAPFNGRTDPSFIINFLFFCSNDVEKAKQRIGRYYELRKVYPNLMQNRDVYDEKLKKIFHQGAVTLDLNAASTQPVVLVGKLDRLDRTDCLMDFFRVGMLSAELGVLEMSERIGKYGCICIYDLENMSYGHVMQLSANMGFSIMHFASEGTPIRQPGVNFINVGFILRQILKIMIFALPAELRITHHVHSGGWECLSGRVPAECLPCEYGGTNGNIQDNIEKLWSTAEKWREYLVDDDKYGFLNDNEK